MKRFIDGDITKLRVNRTLHGRSVYRVKDVPGHNCFKGYNHPGTGDGLDVFAPAGTPIYSPITGTITNLMDLGGSREGVYIAGNGYTVVMAHLHLRDGIQTGVSVQPGDTIGYVGRKISDPHIHIEVWAGAKALSARTARALSKLIAAEIT